ncbi:MAG: prephenate dehydratase domain-containing protein [Eubacteriales bacterium]
MDLLQEAREEIDKIDQEMASLFLRRMTAVKKVVTHKIAHHLPILDSAREQQVIEKNLALFPEEELKGFYQDFITHNMAVARSLQLKIMAKDRIGYQGVAGAFSHIATKNLFPHGQAQSYPTWKGVVQGVEEGAISFGVLPFENSHAGDVSEVLDLCFTHPSIHVTAMYDLPIHQNLLAVKGATLQDIETVISHPQALMQSSTFIENIGAKKEECANTAMAAEYVAKKNDKHIGAIASGETANLYNLQILAPHINQAADNTTRFLVISKDVPQRGNRFSLLFTVKNKAGSLAQVISIVAAEGFNMESIKSRPMPQVSWEYYFYMELVGTGEDSLALKEKLESVCQSLRILGVYERKE